ncbi:hypothetical protein KTH_11140 [Thermosporothrix hazakensis]|jgi:hypothetical protein|nr:hypothetical protein KTH_11140 [Thermosporothrix hazakensis]
MFRFEWDDDGTCMFQDAFYLIKLDMPDPGAGCNSPQVEGAYVLYLSSSSIPGYPFNRVFWFLIDCYQILKFRGSGCLQCMLELARFTLEEHGMERSSILKRVH